MQTRSFYDTILRSAGIEGSSAPADQTASLPVDTGTSAKDESASVDRSNEPAEPPMEEQLAKIWDDANSPVERDKLTGRFQSKNPNATKPQQSAREEPGDDDLDPDFDDDLIGPEGATEKKAGAEDDPTAGEGDDDGPEGATDDMPRSWSKEDAKAWKDMPKHSREVVKRRETQVAQVISRAGNVMRELKAHEPIIRGAEPFREYLAQREQASGVPQGKLVNDLLRFAYRFDTAQSNEDNLNTLNEIVEAFKIDISPWIGRESAESLRPQRIEDPRVSQLTQMVENLTRRLEQEDTHKEEQQNAEVATAIRSFETDSKNFPYARHVKERMSVEIGMMSDEEAARPMEVLLKDAYERACWQHPKIRARLIRDQQRAASEENTNKTQDKAAAARRASSTNVKSGIPSPSKRTSDETLEATAAKFYGR